MGGFVELMNDVPHIWFGVWLRKAFLKGGDMGNHLIGWYKNTLMLVISHPSKRLSVTAHRSLLLLKTDNKVRHLFIGMNDCCHSRSVMSSILTGLQVEDGE